MVKPRVKVPVPPWLSQAVGRVVKADKERGWAASPPMVQLAQELQAAVSSKRADETTIDLIASLVELAQTEAVARGIWMRAARKIQRRCRADEVYTVAYANDSIEEAMRELRRLEQGF